MRGLASFAAACCAVAFCAALVLLSTACRAAQAQSQRQPEAGPAAGVEGRLVAGPEAVRVGQQVKISFAVSGPTDVEVALLSADGRVARHLAAGVLGGKNPPPAPLKPGLSQELLWDGTDDDGQPVDERPLRVRVRIGLRAEFDRFLLYEPDAMPPVVALAPGPNGHLYVFYQDPTANGNQGGHKVRIIDRQGGFVRQILPFAADLPYERIKATGAFQDDQGSLVPHIHNWHSLSFYPDTILARGRSASPFLCPVVDGRGRLYWIITGGRLCALEADGSVPYEDFLGPPLFPDLEYPGGRPALALSSDGKFIYAAGIYDGRWQKAKPVPRVYRIHTQTRRCEVFLGSPGASATQGQRANEARNANQGRSGKESERFVAPRGVAAAGGLLYVADPGAGCVAVFRESDRALVGRMRVTLPHIVQVHPTTGAVYVCSYVPEENPREDGKCRIKDAYLLKYASFEDAEPAYQIALPTTGLSPNGGTHRIALDAAADPPLVWVPGIPYAPSQTARWLSCYRDTGEKFEPVELQPPEAPWGDGPRDMLVDRGRGELYVKVNGERWYQFDEHTAEIKRQVQFPKNDGGPYSGAHGANLGVDRDGNYITHCWGEGRGLMRWGRDLRPLHWQGMNTHRTEWGGMMTFQLNYMALRGNEIHLIKRATGPHHLEVYDLGLNVRRRVVWNVRRGCVPRVDAKGNIYLTAPLRPLDRDFPEFFDGQLQPVPDYFRNIGEGHYWYTYMAGAIVKFPPQGGAFYWIETDREKNDTTGLPEAVAAKPKREYHYFAGGRYPHKVCQVQGAEWVRFGYAPYSETYGAGTPVCMCEGAGFDVDAFGRVFYTNLFRFRVEVIDNNNNFITHFGRYGNQDSGPAGRIRQPAIPLAWPTYVAASDTHAYVNDTIGLRVVSVRLGCRDERTCPVP